MRPIEKLITDSQTIRHLSEIFTPNVALAELVLLLVDEPLFRLQDRSENVGAAKLIAVGANRQVNFVWVRVDLEGLEDPQNYVGRSELHIFPPLRAD